MATSLHVTKTSKEAFLASFKKLRNTSNFSVLYSISPFWNIMWRFTGIFTYYSAHSGSARKYGKYEHYISVFYTLRKLHCTPIRNKISLNFSELSAQCRSSPSIQIILKIIANSTRKHLQAITWRCPVKKVFLNIVRNS